MPDKARELEAKAESLDPVGLCEELDKIKTEVPEALKSELRNFDCAAQTYKFGEEVISDG
jgi:hypothetical protein